MKRRISRQWLSIALLALVTNAAISGEVAKDILSSANNNLANQSVRIVPAAQPPHIDPALYENLLKQIDEAQQKLTAARAGLAGSSQAQSLDLAQQLLSMARLRLSMQPSAEKGLSPAQISVAMTAAQQQINRLRELATKLPNAKLLLEQLDQSQQRLDRSKALPLAALSANDSGELTKEQITKLYEQAQLRLNEARAKAVTLQNSAELLRKLDAAQKRLDQARAGISLQSSVPAN